MIIDDEWLIRCELAGMLQKYPQIELIGEAANADRALEMIAASRPDLVFLDIQMPGKTGFQLLDELSQPVKVIFISAYDHYVEQSKRYHPVGFLLKPIHPQKMAKLLGRVYATLDPKG
jgi:two-component system, LytTR family, response regulator